MAQANHSFSKSDILRELVENFGKTLNIGIIQDVVKQNDFDVHKSTLALLQLSNNNAVSSDNTHRNNFHSINKFNIFGKVSRIPNPENYVSTFAIEATIDDVMKGYKILILLRGLPGSGKSYLAKSIMQASLGSSDYSNHIFSADNFFMRNGVYVYNRQQIEEAHNWNKRKIFHNMVRGYSPLIVDNTNTKLWEMEPYARMAAQCGYKIHILEANTRWSFNCRELGRRNQHNVPKDKIRDMLDRYEKNLTTDILFSNYNLPVEYQKNPQMRIYPPIINTNAYAPVMNSTVSTSAVHNHNAMNQDLNQPAFQQNVQQSTATISQCEVSNLIEISDDDNEADTKIKLDSPTRDKSRNNFPPQSFDFAAWGVDENALRSWDLVRPLQDESNTLLVDLTTNDDTNDTPITSERGINTCLADFHQEPEGSWILYGQYKDINPLGKKLSLNKPGMLDKSCSTQDDISSDRNEDLKKLSDIFEKIPPLYIRDMYDDCKGDFDMTFEIFLEDDKDYSNTTFTNSNNCPSEFDTSQAKKSKLSHPNSLQDSIQVCALPLSSTSSQKPTELMNAVPYEMFNKPSSSKSLASTSFECSTPSTSKAILSERNSNKTPNEDFLMLDYDSDLDFDNGVSQAENDNKSEDNDIIELNLGNNLIEQLEKEFGDPGYDYPKGFQPVVQLPKAFARQLYAFYVESVYQQMEAQKTVLDKLVKEDEAFARKLFEEENGLTKEPQPEGLQEIMNEQVAMNIHEREISEWKNHTPVDLATQLTKKKLAATFPTIDRNVMFEIYEANGRNYEQTVELLLGSVDHKEVRCNTNIRDPPISQTVLQELEKANQDFGVSEDQEEDNNRTSESYREEANNYLQRRQELYQKAQEYFSQGQKEVAQFYSQLAQKQTQYYDMSNNRAASVLLEEHSQRLQNFDTLDLHYLFVKEAIPALDVFIDRNINLLKGGTKVSQNLLVITGRGNRSKNGVSKIKPAVISRLKARKIQFVHLNPGLLKIKVNRNTVITSDI